MANPNFVANMSSNEIWYDTNSNICLTDVVDGKAEVNHTHDGYAETDHTHNGYAAASHTHEGYAAADHAHTGYAEVNHTHTGFASDDHTHAGFAAAGHGHAQSDVTGLEDALSGKADAQHTHECYAASSHSHSLESLGAAAADHSHDYAAAGHTHTGFAAASHGHAQADITGLGDALNGKAEADHTHDYAAASHTHDYLPNSGGALNGDLNVVGVVRVKGQQAIFDNGSRQTFGSGNREHYAIGTKLIANQSWTVASDQRLKEGIEDADVQACIDFINGIDVKTFNYIGSDIPCMGVIAQDVQQSELAKFFVSAMNCEEQYLAVRATDMLFPLIVAFQKLSQRVAELEEKIR